MEPLQYLIIWTIFITSTFKCAVAQFCDTSLDCDGVRYCRFGRCVAHYGLYPGGIVGLVIGGLIVLGLFLFLYWFFRRRRLARMTATCIQPTPYTTTDSTVVTTSSTMAYPTGTAFPPQQPVVRSYYPGQQTLPPKAQGTMQQSPYSNRPPPYSPPNPEASTNAASAGSMANQGFHDAFVPPSVEKTAPYPPPYPGVSQ